MQARFPRKRHTFVTHLPCRRDLYKYVNEVKIPRVGPRPHDSSAAAEAQYKDLVQKIKREVTLCLNYNSKVF